MYESSPSLFSYSSFLFFLLPGIFFLFMQHSSCPFTFFFCRMPPFSFHYSFSFSLYSSSFFFFFFSHSSFPNVFVSLSFLFFTFSIIFSSHILFLSSYSYPFLVSFTFLPLSGDKSQFFPPPAIPCGLQARSRGSGGCRAAAPRSW